MAWTCNLSDRATPLQTLPLRRVIKFGGEGATVDHISTALVKKPFGAAKESSHKVTHPAIFQNGLKWRSLFLRQREGGGGGRWTLKCQGDKKRHLKILSLATHTCGNPGDKGEDVLLWRCLYSLPPWEKSTARQWKCSARNRGRRTIFIHPRLPPSRTTQAWNDRNIKCTLFYSVPAGSRWGTIATSLLRKFLHRQVTSGHHWPPWFQRVQLRDQSH